MILTLAATLELAQRCAPAVAPQTLVSVLRVESGLDPLAIGINSAPRRVLHPASAAEATRVAGALVGRGADLDLGLGQINSRNLGPLGLSLAEAFDPCRNLAASARVLEDGYRRAAPTPGAEQAALRTALSLYNTGDAHRGFRNGYVARVVSAAARLVPAIAPDPGVPRAGDQAQPPTSSDNRPEGLDVFERASPTNVAVF